MIISKDVQIYKTHVILSKYFVALLSFYLNIFIKTQLNRPNCQQKTKCAASKKTCETPHLKW